MASTQQNFTKWTQDYFVIQFSITDAEIDFQAALYNIWWGVAASNGSDGYSGDILLTKVSGAYNPDTNGDNDSARWINGSTLQISMSKDDTSLDAGSYYHELVVSPGTPIDTNDSGSVVSATGLWTLKGPLFPPASRSLAT